MRWLVLFLFSVIAINASGSDNLAWEQGGFKVEVVESSVPQPYFVEKGVAHFVLKSPDTTSFRLTNNSKERVQIIFTFNRLNPMTGRMAVLQDNGFVMDPHQVLVITKGRLSKKKSDKPVPLFSNLPDGSFHFAVFKERTDYPLILPTMTAPPYGPEHFVVENGVRRWVPPHAYPFRRIQDRPNYGFYATYGR